MALEKLDQQSRAALAGIIDERVANDEAFDIASAFSDNLILVLERLQRSKTMLPVELYGHPNAHFYEQLKTPGRQMSAPTFAKMAKFLGVSKVFLYQLMLETRELDSQSIRQLLSEDSRED